MSAPVDPRPGTWVRVPCLLAGLLPLVLLAACTGAGAQPGDDPIETPGATSSSPTQTPSPTPRPTPDQTPGSKGEPLWEAEFAQRDDFEKFQVQRSGDIFLVHGDTAVWAMSKGGKELWDLEPPEPDDPDTDEISVDVVGEVALVSYDKPDDDPWPDRQIVRALDVESGETLWKDDDVAFHTVVGDIVYTTRCNGKQNGRFDNCMVASRDVRTGVSDWTAPTQASARVKPAAIGAHGQDGPQFLLLTVFPNGHEDRTMRTLDPQRAQYFGAQIEVFDRVESATDTLVDGGDWDDDSSDGCSNELTGLDLFTGEPRWQHTWKTKPDGDNCDSLLGDTRHGDLITANDARGLPFLLDLRTGQSQWKGDAEAWVPWLDARRVLLKEPEGGDLRMVDHRSGEDLWTVAHTQLGSGEIEVRGDHVFHYGGSGDVTEDDGAVRILELDSGTLQYQVPGSFVGGGNGWVATAKEGDSQNRTVRVFTQP